MNKTQFKETEIGLNPVGWDVDKCITEEIKKILGWVWGGKYGN